MPGREAQKPTRSGLGTAVAGGGGVVAGGGLAALLAYYPDMPMEIALIWGAAAFGAYAFIAGTAATWARDELEAGNGGFLVRLLAGLGVLVLAVGISGCARRAGPVEVEIWDTASLEVDTPVGSLCLGCYENAEPVVEVIEAPDGGAIIEPAGEEVLVRGVIVEPER